MANYRTLGRISVVDAAKMKKQFWSHIGLAFLDVDVCILFLVVIVYSIREGVEFFSHHQIGAALFNFVIPILIINYGGISMVRVTIRDIKKVLKSTD